MSKREKTGGRIAGTPNRSTRNATGTIWQTFENIGGIERLTEWADENPDKFFTLVWKSIIPNKIEMPAPVTFNITNQVLQLLSEDQLRILSFESSATPAIEHNPS
jgi:hypothetical protein